MAYAATIDVQNAAGGLEMLARLADYDGDGVADPTVIAAAIAAAAAMIDSYAGKRYAVPIATPPTAIVELCARIAVYRMRNQRGTTTQGDLDQHKLDITWLEGLRDGKNTVGIDPLPAPSSLQVDKAGARDSTKNVSREKLKGFW